MLQGASPPSFGSARLRFEYQLSETLGDVEVRRLRSRRLPRRIEARLLGAFDTIEVDAPAFGRVKVGRQTSHGQGEHCIPDLIFFIDARVPPQSALQIAFSPGRDIQIDPTAVGTHFELLVAPRLRPSRL